MTAAQLHEGSEVWVRQAAAAPPPALAANGAGAPSADAAASRTEWLPATVVAAAAGSVRVRGADGAERDAAAGDVELRADDGGAQVRLSVSCAACSTVSVHRVLVCFV